MSHPLSPVSLTRRDALRLMAAGASSLFLGSAARGESVLRDEPMRLAFIGVGGQGRVGIEHLTDHRYIAFADVDESQAARTYGEHPLVPRYRDFRSLLDRHAAEIDAVLICTPDHSHFPLALACMAAGKHVYLEKPMAPTPWECRELQKAAQRFGVKTQLGIQGHSSSSLRMLREWIDAGAIGKIESLHLWTNRMQPERYHWSETLAPGQPVPPTLDWNLWLAGRPHRPFNSEYVPNRWRNWWDLGTGPIGDIGSHMFDVVRYALELDLPEWVEAETPAISDFTAPPWTKATWHYAAATDRSRGPVDLHWYNGTKDGALLRPTHVPRVPSEDIEPLTNAIVFVGTEGSILIDDMRASARPRLYPVERERDLLANPPERRLPRVAGNHYDDLFHAIRTGGQAGAHFGYGAPLTEVILLGTMAQRSQKRLFIDPATRLPKGMSEASSMVRPDISRDWLAGL